MPINKKYILGTLSLFFISIQAVIVEYAVFKKNNAPQVHLFFDVHIGDTRDELYPMEQQHREELLEFLSKQNKNNSKVVIEDLQELIEKQCLFSEDLHNMLDRLVAACKAKGLSAINVDFRAWFSVARSIAYSRLCIERRAMQKNKISMHEFKSIQKELVKCDIPLSRVHQEFKSNMNAIKGLQCGDVLSEYFKQQLKKLEDKFDQSLGKLPNDHTTLFDAICSMFVQENERFNFLDKLDEVDFEFVDLRALYEIHKASREKIKQIFVILGALHSRAISTVLSKLGYQKIWRATKSNIQTCDFLHMPAINLLPTLQCKKPDKNLMQFLTLHIRSLCKSFL